jgi:hypothetical protein
MDIKLIKLDYNIVQKILFIMLLEIMVEMLLLLEIQKNYIMKSHFHIDINY